MHRASKSQHFPAIGVRRGNLKISHSGEVESEDSFLDSDSPVNSQGVKGCVYTQQEIDLLVAQNGFLKISLERARGGIPKEDLLLGPDVNYTKEKVELLVAQVNFLHMDLEQANHKIKHLVKKNEALSEIKEDFDKLSKKLEKVLK